MLRTAAELLENANGPAKGPHFVVTGGGVVAVRPVTGWPHLEYASQTLCLAHNWGWINGS